MKNTLSATILTDLIQQKGIDFIYPCIQDLLKNGLILTRFSDGEIKPPQRQEITQYMAAWSRQVGLSEAECRSWLIDYALVMLSPLSKTSLSGIRHSTKSNIKYIYKYDIPFPCKHEDNPFRAECNRDCSGYAGILYTARPEEDTPPEEAVSAAGVDAGEDPFIPKKDLYKDQFETALQLIHDETMKKTPKKKILQILIEQGLKTRTGRPWTYSILHSELKKKTGFDPDN